MGCELVPGCTDPCAIDPTTVTIDNDTPWARFVEPVPRSVVVFDDAITFAMSPWWNIDELAR